MTHLGHRLSGYLDGELPPPTAELVAAHLAGCPVCRVAAADQRRIKGDLRGLGGPLPSAGLLGSLMELPGSHGPGRGAGFVGFPTASVGRRKRAGMPLFAAGVAGVAALTVASAVFTGAAPQRVHHTTASPVAGGRVRTRADFRGVGDVGHSVLPTEPTPAAARQPEGPTPIGVPLTAAVELVGGPG